MNYLIAMISYLTDQAMFHSLLKLLFWEQYNDVRTAASYQYVCPV